MPEDVKPAKPAKPAVAAPAPAEKPAAAPAAGGAKKDNKTLKIVLIVVGVFVGLGVLATIAMMLFFGSLFKNAAENVDVNDDSVTIQGDDGSKTTIGEGAQLADGFPSDVPIYTPSTLLASSKTEDSSFSAVARTSKSVADVTNYYKSEMAKQGWTTQLDSSSGDGTLLTYQKDNRTSSVVVTSNPDEESDEKTGFVVSVTTQPQ